VLDAGDVHLCSCSCRQDQFHMFCCQICCKQLLLQQQNSLLDCLHALCDVVVLPLILHVLASTAMPADPTSSMQCVLACLPACFLLCVARQVDGCLNRLLKMCCNHITCTLAC
jgi:hypothetical protein